MQRLNHLDKVKDVTKLICITYRNHKFCYHQAANFEPLYIALTYEHFLRAKLSVSSLAKSTRKRTVTSNVTNHQHHRNGHSVGIYARYKDAAGSVFTSKRDKPETDLQKHVTVSSTSMESDVSMAEYLRTFLLPRPNIGTRARRYQRNVGRCVPGA